LKVISRQIVKQICIVLSIVVVIGTTLSFGISLPIVQEKLITVAQRVLRYELGAQVTIEQVEMGLPNKLIFEGVHLDDPLGRPFISINQLKLDVLSFSTWRWVRSPDQTQELYVRYLELDSLTFHLFKQKDSTLNLNFLIRSSVKTQPPKRKLSIRLPEIRIKNSQFSYIDSTHSQINRFEPNKLNFSNLSIEDINTTLSTSWTPQDRMEVWIDELKLLESKTGFRLEYLSSYVCYEIADELPQVSFQDLRLAAQGTRLRGSWRFPGSSLNQVLNGWLKYPSYFTLEQSAIDMATLDYFSPGELPVKGIVTAEGLISGTYDNLESEQLNISYGDSTQVRASVRLKHINSRYTPLDLDVRVRSGVIDPLELRQLLPGIQFPGNLQALGQLRISGTFTGAPNNFVVDFNSDSQIGFVGTILKIYIPSDREVPIRYSGFLKTQNLVWNRLGIEPPLRSNELNLQGKVQGVGSSLVDLNAGLDVIITQSDLWGRRVDSVYANVQVADKKLKGSLEMNDVEGKGDVFVDLDFSRSPASYEVRGTVDQLNTQKYLGYEEPIDLTARLDIDLKGDSIDNLNGDLHMYQIELSRDEDSVDFRIPDLWFQAQDNTRKNKYFILRSALLDADVGGDFSFNQAIQLTKRLAYESKLFVENDSSKINQYYIEKKIDTQKVAVNLGIATRDSINQLFDFLGRDLFISPDAVVIGRLNFGISERASFRIVADSLHLYQNNLAKAELNLDLIKYTNENSLLVVGGTDIGRVHITPNLYYRDLSFNINGLNRVIGSDLVAFQGDSQNRIQLKMETSFPDNARLVSSIDSSYTYFLFEGDTLRIREWNTFTYYSIEKKFEIKDFVVQGRRGILSAEGIVSNTFEDQLDIALQQFDLEQMGALYPLRYNTGGEINLSLQLRELFEQPKIQLRATIDSLSVNKFTYGDISMAGGWDRQLKSFTYQVKLTDAGDTTLSLMGVYDMSNEKEPLNMNLITQKSFPLDYIKPFVEGEIYGLSGQVALESFSIHGDWDDLQVLGTGFFEDAHFGVDYLQSDYRFNGQIEFDNNRIIFPRITLYDQYNNTADFHGSIFHKGLQQFEFDIQLDEIRNFLIINTQREDNSLYYGSLYLKNGIASITGNLDQLDINAFVMSGRNTQLKIPVTASESVKKPDFIRFVGERDGKPLKINTGIKGFDLNISVRATEEAQVEMIFDEKVGDIIRMSGNGNINLKINEQGDFSMLGTYEILEGNYLFTARNVLNKKFQVKPGGTISWTGDPYSAQLNLEAIYPLYADIKDLIASEVTRRVPTNVLMHMEGSLMKPSISLDIELPNLNETDVIDISSLLRTVTYDEQELNKQVFSLMVFNRFAPPGGFWETDVANTGVTTSISELLSNQLNYWLSQALSDNVNVNVGTSNFQDVNLLISAKLFDDRVTIERDGILIGPGNSGLAVGNIRIIIRLIKPERALEGKGELVLEVFNRENLNFSQQFSNQRGLGIFYKRDFDNLKNILLKE